MKLLPLHSGLPRRFGGWLAVVLIPLSCVGKEEPPPPAPSLEAAVLPGVIINEIMYHPPLDRDDLQYVELFNRGERAVDLSGWSFIRGIRFTFPKNSRLEPGAFAVVVRNRASFSEHYGTEIPTAGTFTGRLSHSGERLFLADAAGSEVDGVDYSDGGRWPSGPDGYSPSLERICPLSDSGDPANWAASKLPDVRRAGGTPGRRNDSYSADLPPVVGDVEHRPLCPRPEQDLLVSVEVADADGVSSVTLLYTVAASGKESGETSLRMERWWGDGKRGTYRATIPGQADRTLVRFRVRAVDARGETRIEPSENEPCRTFSCYVYENRERATIPLGFIVNVGDPPAVAAGRRWRARSRRHASPERTRGNSAFIYVPAGGNEYFTFDHVRISPRHGGFKVRFHKGHKLSGMSVANLIFEDQPRFVLAEPLAYEVYRMAGVPAELTEHLRLSIDDRFLGYHLLVEQPNKSFLRRNGRDTSGHLYKLLWYGDGVVGKHEKKTRTTEGHEDLIEAIEGLNGTSGGRQWEFIREHFDVEVFASYFAVNMCISNWDGFFNNYFVYHDTGDSGKWEIYPWDEDKTWGDYDGAPPDYAFYDMPITFGMNGAVPTGRRGFGGPFGGGRSWWRPPGYFSGPLLANPSFRRRFLSRLRELCMTVFREESLLPVIDAMERRLEPEVRLRAEMFGEDVEAALGRFRGHMESFRRQVTERRKFLLAQPELKEES